MATAHDMLKKNAPKASTSKCTPEYSTPNCHQNKCYQCNGLEQCQTMQHCKSKKLDAVMSFFFIFFYRSLVTQLAAPKIPEGERVDFDVCPRINVMTAAQA